MHFEATWELEDDNAVSGEPTLTPKTARPSPVSNARLLTLTRSLQTTLNLSRLLEIFAAECREVVPFDSLAFANDADGTSLRLGEAGRHTLSYGLVLGTERLGQLTFSRDKRFGVRETERLDVLGSHLLYPLRNALLYRNALLVAARDPLTGAFNRATLEHSLHREVGLARRHDTPFSVVMLDLDHFKTINDRHGHLVGDCVLKEAVRLFQRCVRDSDLLFRFGGEEFAVLLANSDLAGARRLAERMRGAMAAARITCSGHTVSVSVSAGVAQWRDDEPPDGVLRRADAALYDAKEAGRDRVMTE